MNSSTLIFGECNPYHYVIFDRDERFLHSDEDSSGRKLLIEMKPFKACSQFTYDSIMWNLTVRSQQMTISYVYRMREREGGSVVLSCLSLKVARAYGPKADELIPQKNAL